MTSIALCEPVKLVATDIRLSGWKIVPGLDGPRIGGSLACIRSSGFTFLADSHHLKPRRAKLAAAFQKPFRIRL